MGVVYRATQESPRRTVAVKVVRAGMISAALLRRFEHEVEALGRLDHPGIASIYEAGMGEVRWSGSQPSEQPYFAMELVEGVPLTRFAREQGLTARGCLALLARICDAVHHGHQRGVIHRDLKPANILVRLDGQPKIIDFGVARAAGVAGAGDTQAGQVIGTLAYMSPEQVGGEPVDTRADVYALGAIGYELLSCRLPVNTETLPFAEAASAIRGSEPARLGTLDRALRGDIELVVAKALEKDPSARYPSASDLGADLRRILAEQPVAAREATDALHAAEVRTPQPRPRGGRWRCGRGDAPGSDGRDVAGGPGDAPA
jgi:serine/threonine protein kinase